MPSKFSVPSHGQSVDIHPTFWKTLSFLVRSLQEQTEESQIRQQTSFANGETTVQDVGGTEISACLRRQT